MKKIKALLFIAFGAFLGITFPEQIGAGFDYLANVDYAALWMSIKSGAVSAYDYVLGFFKPAVA